MSIVRMLWKRRALAVAVALPLALAVVFIVSRLPSVYQAEAIVLVDSQKIPEKFVASTVQVSLQDSLNTISQQVLSNDHLASMIETFKLYPELRDTKKVAELTQLLKSDIVITLERGITPGRAGAFRIAYESRRADVAAGVVNHVANLFVRMNERSREERAEGTSEFIEQRLTEAKRSLDNQESQLSSFKQRWSGELPQQENALSGALSRLQTELQANQEAAARAQQNKLVLENTLRFAEGALASLSRAQVGTANPTGAGGPAPLERRSEQLRAQLDEATRRYFDEHPEVKRLRRELARALEDESRQPAPAAARPALPAAPPVANPALESELAQQRERLASTRTQLRIVEQDIAARNADHDRIVKDIANYQTRLEKLPIREQQLSGLTRDYETSKANYRSLLDKKISADMASDMEKSNQSERFQISDPARVPERPIRPRRLVYAGAGSLGALALGLLLALALELKENRFLGEWELPAQVKVLGRVSVCGDSASRLALWVCVLGALLHGGQR